MTVVLRAFRDKSGNLGGFTADLRIAISDAHQVGRLDHAKRLYELFIEYFLVHLGSMTASELDDYLAEREPWKSTDEALVYRTPDFPSIAFGVQADRGGVYSVTALAICRELPGGSHETWWNNVVQPRVRTL